MLGICSCSNPVEGHLLDKQEITCTHDYEHWLRSHAKAMREQIGNPASRNPNISGYILEKLVGKGSFGVVFLAKARETQEQFAIKVFSKSRVNNPNNAYSITRERNMLACLHHPFIIRLVDSFQCSRNLYVVTDFMEYGCLHDHLRLKQKFDFEEVRYMAAMLVMGVEYIHRMNIVHRDLKPKNILVGKEGWLKISDMGISYVLKDASSFVCDSKIVGTSGYIAPEILKKEPYNFAVDWYSLGVVIFELLVGVGPDVYKAEQAPELRRSTVRFPASINSVSRDLILRLLARNPSYRLGNLSSKVNLVRAHLFFRSVNFIGLLNKSIKVAYRPSIDEKQDFFFFSEATDSAKQVKEDLFMHKTQIHNQNWFAEF